MMNDDTQRGSASFDLHGVVSVRVLDAQPRDIRTVARQLGPIRTEDDSADADITIRFVDRLVTDSRVRYLGRHDGGFTDDAFLVLRSQHKAQTRARIPMAEIGGKCEIVCEHGTPRVPLLLAIVNLTAVSKGVLPLHAAAFDWNGTGVVVTGWSKGGKTESLLAFMSRGARYIADEWCYIGSDGRRIFGVPEPVRLWRWQLAQLPHYRRRVPAPSRMKMAALGVFPAVQAALPTKWQRTRGGRLLQRLTHFVEQHQNTLVPPERLFDQGVSETEGIFDHLVFIVSTESSATTVRRIAPEEVADRMLHSLIFERHPLNQYYRMFRFAFPGAANRYLEQAEARERELLQRAFKDKPALCVEHPYPVELSDLFDCLEPLIS